MEGHADASELLSAGEPFLRSISFCADALDRAGIPLGGLDSECLTRVAPMTKGGLRDTHWRERCALTSEGGIILGSSGTTGVPTIYKWTYSDLRHVGKVTQPLRQALGVHPGDIGAVWAPIDRSVMGQCMLAEFLQEGIDVHILGAVTPDVALEQLHGSGATVLKGLPKALLGLGSLPAAHDLPLRQVHVGGDLLTERIRRGIETTLDCRCYNFYGLSEIYGPLAAECLQQNGMHYLENDTLLEVVDPSTGRPSAPGAIGVAVFTTLWEKCSPALRYFSGDLVEVLQQPCACGSDLPRIVHHGRLRGYDYEGCRPLSALLVDSIISRHSEGLVDFRLTLENDGASLAVFVSSDVDEVSLADELGEYLRGAVGVETVFEEGVSRESKEMTLVDRRTVTNGDVPRWPR